MPGRADDAAGPAPSARRPVPPGLRERSEEVLRALVGRADARLREDQWRAVEALVVDRRRVLVVERTGWGKSAVYFVATALIREGWGPQGLVAEGRRRPGATVIISPLLALMRDQVAAARRAGIAAETMNSANTTSWDEVQARVACGEVDVLLVSPERLNNPVFREEVLPHLASDAGLVVIDEAHCVSDWGHDFRPDYRRIRTLLAELPSGTPVLATTATANERVTVDVAEQLAVSQGARPRPGVGHGEPGPRGSGAGPHAAPGTELQSVQEAETGVLVLRGSLDRASLHLGVVHLPDAASRLARLTTYLQRTPGSGIVYCLTVSATQEVAEHLAEAGLAVATYSGRTDATERERLEEDLRANRVRALVSTSALGMGFDKPDLAFVVHVGAPSSPIAYYQQVGRAGRGVDRAEVVLLPGAEDRRIWQWFGEQGFPAEPDVRQVLDVLQARTGQGAGAASTAWLETVTDLRRTRLESMLKVLDVDGAVRRVRGGWVSTGEPWTYDSERYARVAAARAAEQDAMLSYESLPEAGRDLGAPGAGGRQGHPGADGSEGARDVRRGPGRRAAGACRMAFLRAALDDPQLEEGWHCGRCDLCGGLDLPTAVDAGRLASAQAGLHRLGVVLTPRRQWPTGMDRLGLADLSGRIGPGEQAAAGLAVGRLDGLGVSAALRATLEPTGRAIGPQGGESGSATGSGEGTTEGTDAGTDAGTAPHATEGTVPHTTAGTDTGGRQLEPPEARAGADGTVPSTLRSAVLEVTDRLASTMTKADGTAGADAVVVIDSRSRTTLVRHLGRAVAHRLEARPLGVVGVRGPAGRHDVNSPTRLAHVARSLTLDGWNATALAGLEGATVVLVDDLTDSGWTLTMAASLLRHAGAGAVHPLVLAQR